MSQSDRAFFESLLEGIHSGTVVVRFADGTSRSFGRGMHRATVKVSDRSIRRALREGTVGFCDGYVQREWEVVDGTLLGYLDAVVSIGLARRIHDIAGKRTKARLAAGHLWAQAGRANRWKSVRAHYELDTDFYALWLDPELVYTCGFARSPDDDLATMQRQKMDLVLDKLHTSPGQSFLDLGCGWGALSIRAARDRGLRVTALNVARNQIEHLERRLRDEKVIGVETQLADLRQARGSYDRIAAVGLAEHSGKRGLGTLFRVIDEHLADEGIALVQTSASANRGGTDPWLERAIFPGSYVPTLSELAREAERRSLRIAHVENLGPHYALTLRHWLAAFQRNVETVERRYGAEFTRAWEMYLTMLIPTFEHLSTQLVQLVLTKGEGAHKGVGIGRYGAPGFLR